jgi:membrane protease YdiL (CAAX protease family)
MAFVPAMVLTSLLFVGAHVPGWLIFMHYSLQHMLSSGAYIFVASIVFSVLVQKTGALYPSIVLHAINDIIAL